MRANTALVIEPAAKLDASAVLGHRFIGNHTTHGIVNRRDKHRNHSDKGA